MSRYVLLDKTRTALCAVEAADASHAASYGRRYVAGYAALEGETDFDARTHGKAVESYRRLFKGQGKDEATAAKMAETAAGGRGIRDLKFVFVDAAGNKVA